MIWPGKANYFVIVNRNCVSGTLLGAMLDTATGQNGQGRPWVQYIDRLALTCGIDRDVATISCPDYGPSVGALNAESPKRTFRKNKKENGHEIGVILTDLPHILHERSCNHFQ